MKKLPIRRLAAGILSLILLLSLTACNKESEKKPATGGNLVEQNPDVAGLLLVNIQTEIQVAYDADGKVLYVEGTNTDGVFLSAVMEELQGMSCADVVADIIGLAIEKNVTGDATTIVVKQQRGSATPGSSFLKNIAEEAQRAAAADFTVFTISASELDDMGYLSFEAADAILRTALSLSDDLHLPSTTTQFSGLYYFTIPMGMEDVEYCVNANSGAVTTAGSLGLDFDTGETVPEPDIPEDPYPEYPDEEIMDMPETPD